MSVADTLTAVVPTLALGERRDSLLAALDSILSQRGVGARVVVVVNGTRFDRALVAGLERRAGVRVVHQPAASLPQAILTGRRHCAGALFCFLDDDDTLLPDTLARRVALARDNPQVDVVVSNGLQRPADRAGPDLPCADFAAAEADPLHALLTRNWLASCGGLYRATTVGDDVFTALPRYYEWTNVAFRLALSGRRMLFDDAPAFVVNETPGSLSRTAAYAEAAPAMLAGLLALELPDSVRRGIEDKLCDACHVVAERHRRDGNRASALRHHLRSLRSRRGLTRYLLYTWKLLR